MMQANPPISASDEQLTAIIRSQENSLSNDILNSRHAQGNDYLKIQSLQVRYGTLTVVDGMSFGLAQGEIGCLLGFSGCGKTTAMRAIAGLEMPSEGVIRLGDRLLTDCTNGRTMHLAPAQRHMGMVFQDYALFSHLTVAQNIGFGIHKLPKAAQRERIEEMLALVGLSDSADKRIGELSGGQQQRVALARALAPKPELLLMDEPFSNLDMRLRESLAAKVRDILKQTCTTAILVTHDQHEAFAIADKVGVMQAGRLAQWATPAELYHQPVSSFVASFVGEGTMIAGKINTHAQNAIKTGTTQKVTAQSEDFSQSSVSRCDIHQGEIETALGIIPLCPEPIHPAHMDEGLSKEHAIAPRTATSAALPIQDMNEGKISLTSPTTVKVLIRPDDILHDDDSELQVEVVDRVFRGANYLYRLRLTSGEEVLSLIPSHHDHPIGSKIGIRPQLAHVVVFVE